LRWPAGDVADQLDDLLAITGAPPAMAASWLRDAARLAEAHALSFYGASWAAAASALGVTLVSADRRPLAAGLAESLSEFAARLKLSS
jgi:predicted nucleic acid-binding protein